MGFLCLFRNAGALITGNFSKAIQDVYNFLIFSYLVIVILFASYSVSF